MRCMYGQGTVAPGALAWGDVKTGMKFVQGQGDNNTQWFTAGTIYTVTAITDPALDRYKANQLTLFNNDPGVPLLWGDNPAVYCNTTDETSGYVKFDVDLAHNLGAAGTWVESVVLRYAYRVA